MTSRPLLLCVPNFSTSDADTVQELVGAAEGVHVLDFSSDIDHGRSVITMAGTPDRMKISVVAMGRVAAERIDLSAHVGVHPRTGAMDVVPFVPVAGAGMEDAVAAALDTAEALAAQGIPAVMYGAASVPERTLPDARRSVRADGPSEMAGAIRSAGVTIVGARYPLVAFNVNVSTQDSQIARKIAAEVRQESVRALGFSLHSRKMTQVSMNLIQPDVVTMPMAFERVTELARQTGTEVTESECIGLATRASTGGQEYFSYGLAKAPKILEDLVAAIQ